MIVRRLNEILADPNMQEQNLTVELSRTRNPGGGHGGRRQGSKNRLSLQSLNSRMNQMDTRITRIERAIEESRTQPPLWFKQFQTNLDNRLNQIENRINQVEANLNARLDRIVQLNNLKQ